MHFPAIGWAKPVPVNPYRLHSPRADMALVAFSGPLSNMLLIVVSMIGLKIVSFGFLGAALSDPLAIIFVSAIQINLLLAVFNLIPIFPLDGSQIALGLLKGNALEIYEKHLPYGMYIIMGLVFTGAVQYILAPVLHLAMLLMALILG